jgi:hypothetical protein
MATSTTMSTDPLYLDNSTLKAVARCSTEAFLRYVHAQTTPEERATLKSGTAVHAALAEHLRGRGDSAAMEALSDEYEEWGKANVADADRLSWPNVEAVMAAWLESHPLHDLPFVVPSADFVEVGFSEPLDDAGEFIFCGRLDAFGERRADGIPCLIEHKSTGAINAEWLRQFRKDSQVSGYVWGAQRHLGQRIVDVYVNAIEVKKLPSSDRKCKEHGVPHSECTAQHAKSEILIVSRSDEQLVEWRKTALHLARRYKDLLLRYPSVADVAKVRTQGTFHNACRYCQFDDFCNAGRPANLIGSMFVEDRWSPFDHAQTGQVSAR